MIELTEAQEKELVENAIPLDELPQNDHGGIYISELYDQHYMTVDGHDGIQTNYWVPISSFLFAALHAEQVTKENQ